MKVKIKKLKPNAVIPTYAHSDDAGMDLTATSISVDGDGNIVYGTGLAFEIPKGYVGMVFPRSSNSKKDLLLTNSVGIVDCGYIGEVTLKFRPNLDFAKSVDTNSVNPSCVANYKVKNTIYKVGERVGQIIIMPYPHIEFEEVAELSETERGAGGYGSTGK